MAPQATEGGLIHQPRQQPLPLVSHANHPGQLQTPDQAPPGALQGMGVTAGVPALQRIPPR